MCRVPCMHRVYQASVSVLESLQMLYLGLGGAVARKTQNL